MFESFKSKSEDNEDIHTSMIDVAKDKVVKTISRNKIKTALILGSFALLFAGKVIIEPKEDTGEKWFE